MKILIALFPLIAFAGEDISVDKDNSGHRIERQSVYGIGTLGAGRFNGENSVAVGGGIGIKLAERERLAFFGEATINHYGTYHTGAQHCVPVLASAGEYEKPEEQPARRPVEQCANIEDAQDYMGAIFEFKANLDIDRSWEPFLACGAAIGDVDGIVCGGGLQWGNKRLHVRKDGSRALVTFGYEFW